MSSISSSLAVSSIVSASAQSISLDSKLEDLSAGGDGEGERELRDRLEFATFCIDPTEET